MGRKQMGTKSEIKLSNHPEFRMFVGTENKKSPTTVWVTLATWLVNDRPDELTPRDIRLLNTKIKRALSDPHDLVFNTERTISIITYPQQINTGKHQPHFTQLELSLVQRRGQILAWDDYNLQTCMQLFAEEVIDIIKREGFEFSLTRVKNIEPIVEY